MIAGGELGERRKIIRLKLGKKTEPAGINAQNRFVTTHRDRGLVKDGSVSADGNDEVTAEKEVAGFTGQNSVNSQGIRIPASHRRGQAAAAQLIDRCPDTASRIGKSQIGKN